MTGKVVRRVEDSADLEALTAMLSPIAGELCLSARLGYARELRLECGDPGLAGEASWTLSMRATPWELRRRLEVVASSAEEPDDDLRARIRAIEGLRIERCEVRFPDLQLALSFAQDLRLAVGPEGRDGDVPSPDDVLPYWLVFTPNRRVLSAGPGPVWSEGSADDLFT